MEDMRIYLFTVSPSLALLISCVEDVLAQPAASYSSKVAATFFPTSTCPILSSCDYIGTTAANHMRAA